MANNYNSKFPTVWDYKPWWCQPWSILLTGVTMITGSWLLLKVIWITSGISVMIIAWWVYFLILYPQMMQEYLTQQSQSSTIKADNPSSKS